METIAGYNVIASQKYEVIQKQRAALINSASRIAPGTGGTPSVASYAIITVSLKPSLSRLSRFS